VVKKPSRSYQPELGWGEEGVLGGSQQRAASEEGAGKPAGSTPLCCLNHPRSLGQAAH